MQPCRRGFSRTSRNCSTKPTPVLPGMGEAAGEEGEMSNRGSHAARRPGDRGNGRDSLWFEAADEAAMREWRREQGMALRRASDTWPALADVPVPIPDDEVERERRRRQERNQRIAEATADWRARTPWYLARAGVPPNLCGARWSAFRLLPGKRDAAKIAREYGQRTRKKPGLLFWGPVGAGKSCLCALVLGDWLQQGRPLETMDAPPVMDWTETWEPGLRWVNVAALLREIRRKCFDRHESNEADEVDALIAVPLLVLDDAAVRDLTPWGEDILLGVVDGRCSRRARTLGTTNLNLAGLASTVGERTASRLAESCEVIEVGGADMRRVEG